MGAMCGCALCDGGMEARGYCGNTDKVVVILKEVLWVDRKDKQVGVGKVFATNLFWML